MCNDGMRIPGVCDRYSDCLFYVKYRHMEGLQMVLNTLRPAVIALILTSGITILTQAFFRKVI